ncbi:hypothetical protein PoB_005704300 [Plakobranchus ocellatus]|uniref:Uncharacterized protein n=1 Tax=Plakobranchus ocellatus TaxID=259542 RepID=A0AAV4CHK6_9GAST|nr:hypothetical protein PoB_005704300 [Plakobranchus ocellatus]
MSIEMYQDSRSRPQQKCRSRCAKRVKVDHCRTVDRGISRQKQRCTAEMSMEMYQDSRRSRCAKTVEVDHRRNVDRHVPRQWKWCTD